MVWCDQVLFSNFVALVWNTYMSWVNHQGHHGADEEPEAATA